MNRLVVWITLPSGERVRCGEIVCSDPDSRGKLAGAFRYTPQWINHPRRFALDPNELPLSNDEFLCDRPRGIFPVFEDALPDDWGRRFLIRKANLGRGEQTLVNLLKALNGNALGALSFFPEDYQRQDTSGATLLDLENLVDAALAYEAGKQLGDTDLHLLFAAASSPGGARPKVVVGTDDGDQWIAKFPSAKDNMAMVPIEAATMALAGLAGMKVPDFRVQRCGKHNVLLVKRFDISDDGGRRHMISYQTLMQATGYYALGYMDLFEPLRRISSKPSTDIPALYRQMVFNALIGNTDDHLKNFCLLHDDSGFYLSPAYDLLPDTADRREHVLHFTPNFHFPGIKHLIQLGQMAGIPSPKKIVDQVVAVVSNWQSAFHHWHVPEQDIQRLASSINNRLQKKTV
jgi:serine/threonine-protein kinase HipA